MRDMVSEPIKIMDLQRGSDAELMNCLKSIVQSDDPDVVELALNSLNEIIVNENSCNFDHCLKRLFTEEEIKNVDQVPNLFDWFSTKFPNFPWPSLSNDMAKFLSKSAEHFKNQPPCLAEILQLFNRYQKKDCYRSPDHEDLCEAIVKILFYMPQPKPKDVKKYCKDLEEIKGFLKSLCRNKDRTDISNTALNCFKTMCELIFNNMNGPKPATEPSSALVMVLQIVEDNFWKNHMGGVVEEMTSLVKNDDRISEESAQTQNVLSDSHSDSTDSGIQSVGGEDCTSSSSSASSSGSSSNYLVHRVFGGELRVSYQCLRCDNQSHNTDSFRDLQLCFLDSLKLTDNINVQGLINANYLTPETLTGDNKYRCDKCANLCDASRIIKVLKAPAHLILTLKHFRYNSETRLRQKLRNKIQYDQTIQLPVFDQDPVSYKLYAAVVHSGYSMDYGHYFTYACDGDSQWYKFNDSYVSETTFEDFKRLEPPDTPYILFYKKCTDAREQEDVELMSLSKRLQDYVEDDRRMHGEDRRNIRIAKPSASRYNYYNRDRNDDDDDKPPSHCQKKINNLDSRPRAQPLHLHHHDHHRRRRCKHTPRCCCCASRRRRARKSAKVDASARGVSLGCVMLLLIASASCTEALYERHISSS
ncbi:unnamed protein product [Trichogramma brassicae]|uniref:USP domain-containing protein n=1 Tax=Trichogramma brassicae TaxID=86971 RepID=A0A6H5ID64_9HYME|nr:unnamed protein product [Trichogramma brassicae]